jgi:PQQ system protein
MHSLCPNGLFLFVRLILNYKNCVMRISQTKERFSRWTIFLFTLLIVGMFMSGCRMMRLMKIMAGTSDPNEKILGQLFVLGGGGTARFGSDGVARISVEHRPMETILRPAVITMDRPGELEMTFNNNNPQVHLMILVQSNGGVQVIDLPPVRSGRARVHFGSPGLYMFMDAMGNYMGRGMMGMVVVEGEVPQEAKLDRPKQRRP